MRFIGNVIWLVFGGFISSLLWGLSGILLCITIVGIPFGTQCFKISSLVLWPFKKDVSIGEFGVMGFFGNVIWILLLGWELAINHVICALICYITIIGIPFGNQHMKFAKLALIPFGAKIYRK